MKPGRLTAAALAALAVIILTAATLWVANAQARRSPVIACRLGPEVALYSSLGRLPEAIAGKRAGPAGYGGLALRDGYLNGTDVADLGIAGAAAHRRRTLARSTVPCGMSMAATPRMRIQRYSTSPPMPKRRYCWRL
jgi:hypothetical protein